MTQKRLRLDVAPGVGLHTGWRAVADPAEVQTPGRSEGEDVFRTERRDPPDQADISLFR